MVKRYLPAAVAVLGYGLSVAALAFFDWRVAVLGTGLALIYEAREAAR